MQMRYELNFDEDRIIDIEAIGGDGVLDLKDCCDLLNKLNDENEQLLRYKYFVKAVEVFTDCPISETIADYSDGELFDEEEQLEFGKKMLEQEKEDG